MVTMDGHHLILGEIVDFLTNRFVADTHDERYRQKLARLLVLEKGYRTQQILTRIGLTVHADEHMARVPLDFVVFHKKQAAMCIKYAPGSLVTRHRPAMALARLFAEYQIPVTVVTNGEDAHVLDSSTGKTVASELASVPDAYELQVMVESSGYKPVSPKRAVLESRIVYAYEVDGACPCDDTVCKTIT